MSSRRCAKFELATNAITLAAAASILRRWWRSWGGDALAFYLVDCAIGAILDDLLKGMGVPCCRKAIAEYTRIATQCWSDPLLRNIGSFPKVQR